MRPLPLGLVCRFERISGLVRTIWLPAPTKHLPIWTNWWLTRTISVPVFPTTLLGLVCGFKRISGLVRTTWLPAPTKLLLPIWSK